MYIPILITLLLAPTIQAEDTHDPDSRTFNVVAYSPAVPQEIQTVEIIGADTRATTFKYECLDSASRYVTPTGLWETLDTTTRPSHPSTMKSGFTCDSYTYTQGPSTWAMSFTGLDVTYSGSCTKSARDRDFDSCEAAIEYDPSMNRADEGGFGMTNWMSNNRTVLAIVYSTLTFSFQPTATPASPSTATTTPSTASSGRAGSLARPTGAVFDFEMGGAIMLAGALAL